MSWEGPHRFRLDVRHPVHRVAIGGSLMPRRYLFVRSPDRPILCGLITFTCSLPHRRREIIEKSIIASSTWLNQSIVSIQCLWMIRICQAKRSMRISVLLLLVHPAHRSQAARETARPRPKANASVFSAKMNESRSRILPLPWQAIGQVETARGILSTATLISPIPGVDRRPPRAGTVGQLDKAIACARGG